jgi:hypothetical protein
MAGALWDGGISGHSLGELGTQCVCVLFHPVMAESFCQTDEHPFLSQKFPYALFGLVIRRFLSGGGGMAARGSAS